MIPSILSFFASSTLALGADATEPHPHQGVLTPYVGAPPRPALSADDLATLATGKPVTKQVQTASGTDAAGRGVAVLDIHAESAVIWDRILDFPAYPRMVPNVKECDVYGSAGDTRDVHFVIGAPLVSIEYWIRHEVHVDQGYMTWRLDYTRHSDFDDTVGFWRVDPLPDRPGWSRVFYSVDLNAAGWVPPPIEHAFASIGLTKATAWVAREAEVAAGTTPEAAAR
ncbi:MAG: SRPBCC family protein [Myxococcota bacterium]